MRTAFGFPCHWCLRGLLILFLTLAVSHAADKGSPWVGLARRDITPETPIRLAGYAGRTRPADKVDAPLLAQALAFKNPAGERFVFVALDNCEVSHPFVQPVLEQVLAKFQLPIGAVAVVSSHTHSGPVLADTLPGMPQAPAASEDQQRVQNYSGALQSNLVAVVGEALDDVQPAVLEYGVGQARFAMNRRVYRDDKVVFGDNPDGPVDFDVPVLRVKGTNGVLRAIVFGYACHGTSVRTGDDWYMVSPEYMGYTRQLLETHHPGAKALYLTGMGADSDPFPRGPLLEAKRHGVELAGAVMDVLDHPMAPVRRHLRFAYEQVELPLVAPPTRAQIEMDVTNRVVSVQQRAKLYLKLLDEGQPLPRSLALPIAAVRLGDDLTFLLMGGETVVDYSRRLKRLLAFDHPWTIGYAYEVPCYIPSARVIKEGGYESESSLIYYGLYGPFHPSVEDLLVKRMQTLVAGLRTQ